MAALIGRRSELALAREHLTSAESPVLLFVGSAGIGKSTLLNATAALAGELGFDVKCSRAAVQESGLAASTRPV